MIGKQKRLVRLLFVVLLVIQFRPAYSEQLKLEIAYVGFTSLWFTPTTVDNVSERADCIVKTGFPLVFDKEFVITELTPQDFRGRSLAVVFSYVSGSERVNVGAIDLQGVFIHGMREIDLTPDQIGLLQEVVLELNGKRPDSKTTAQCDREMQEEIANFLQGSEYTFKEILKGKHYR